MLTCDGSFLKRTLNASHSTLFFLLTTTTTDNTQPPLSLLNHSPTHALKQAPLISHVHSSDTTISHHLWRRNPLTFCITCTAFDYNRQDLLKSSLQQLFLQK
jgi:hypothetical protein